MAENYLYRMDHDTGFAPNTDYGICTLGGCMTTTVEQWADRGSWVIAIGGDGTGQPDKLIYAMEVDHKLPYKKFKSRYPRKSQYLYGKSVPSVLISKRFYYLGNAAVALPRALRHIIVNRHGCRRITDKDIVKLKRFLTRRYKKYGSQGMPNNPQPRKYRSRCGCSR